MSTSPPVIFDAYKVVLRQPKKRGSTHYLGSELRRGHSAYQDGTFTVGIYLRDYLCLKHSRFSPKSAPLLDTITPVA